MSAETDDPRAPLPAPWSIVLAAMLSLACAGCGASLPALAPVGLGSPIGSTLIARLRPLGRSVTAIITVIDPEGEMTARRTCTFTREEHRPGCGVISEWRRGAGNYRVIAQYLTPDQREESREASVAIHGDEHSVEVFAFFEEDGSLEPLESYTRRPADPRIEIYPSGPQRRPGEPLAMTLINGSDRPITVSRHMLGAIGTVMRVNADGSWSRAPHTAGDYCGTGIGEVTLLPGEHIPVVEGRGQRGVSLTSGRYLFVVLLDDETTGPSSSWIATGEFVLEP